MMGERDAWRIAAARTMPASRGAGLPSISAMGGLQVSWLKNQGSAKQHAPSALITRPRSTVIRRSSQTQPQTVQATSLINSTRSLDPSSELRLILLRGGLG